MELARRHPNDPLNFAQAHRRFGGRPMVIPPAMHEIYRDPHPFLVVQKPSQVGVTEMCVNRALHAAALPLGDRGVVLYLMPTQENADRLSQARVASAFNASEPLQALIDQAAEGARAPQRMQMRAVGRGLVYFSGSDQVTQYTGIDADLVVLDEFDLMRDDVLSNAQSRLRSSRDGRLLVVSTPTIPEFGVHGLLQQSDERHDELRCAGCGIWVEPRYPDHVDFDRELVVCGCGAHLPHDLPGRWVPRRPNVTEIRAYQLNRLVLPSPPIRQMRLAAAGTVGMRREEFWRHDLGVPYVTDDARLTAADLDRCRVERLPPMLDVPLVNEIRPAATVVGVDVGQRAFWIVVRSYWNKRSYLRFAERVEGDWDAVVEICRRFSASWCVVDAQPDTRGAAWLQRELANRPPVFICYYDRKHAHDYDWGGGATPHTVHASRTLALDETFEAIRRGRSLLPPNARELAGGAYYPHMQSLVRTTEPDEFGQAIPTYRHTRPDDFAHAEAYIMLAAQYWGTWGEWWERI